MMGRLGSVWWSVATTAALLSIDATSIFAAGSSASQARRLDETPGTAQQIVEAALREQQQEAAGGGDRASTGSIDHNDVALFDIEQDANGTVIGIVAHNNNNDVVGHAVVPKEKGALTEEDKQPTESSNNINNDADMIIRIPCHFVQENEAGGQHAVIECHNNNQDEILDIPMHLEFEDDGTPILVYTGADGKDVFRYPLPEQSSSGSPTNTTPDDNASSSSDDSSDSFNRKDDFLGLGLNQKQALTALALMGASVLVILTCLVCVVRAFCCRGEHDNTRLFYTDNHNNNDNSHNRRNNDKPYGRYIDETSMSSGSSAGGGEPYHPQHELTPNGEEFSEVSLDLAESGANGEDPRVAQLRAAQLRAKQQGVYPPCFVAETRQVHSLRGESHGRRPFE